MGYRTMGRAHAGLHHLHDDLRRRLTDQSGQGTVEYVALILLVAGVFAMVVTAGGASDFDLTKQITGKLKDAIDSVGGKKS